MTRRKVLKSLGFGVPAALALASGNRAWASVGDSASQAKDTAGRTIVDGLDLNDIPVIDAHIHGLSRQNLSQSFTQWFDSFVDVMAPSEDFPGKSKRREVLRAEFAKQIWGYSRQPSYQNYMARMYGIPPTIEAVDAYIDRHIQSDAAFTAHIAELFDREKISSVVMQSADPEPVPLKSAVPSGRFVWTWPIDKLTQIGWAKRKGLVTLQDVLGAVDRTLETAASNGCRGFKNPSAYYRAFTLSRVTARQAEDALKRLIAATPVEETGRGGARFATPELENDVRVYADFLFRHIYVKAGLLEVPVVVHTCVAMHPSLRPDLNDPTPFYDIVMDPQIQKAGTRFVLIHTGWPSHHVVASMISQFPNVYTDMSFVCQFAGALEQSYRAMLSFGPSEKILHGSDINTVPEGIGFCANNSRVVLARIFDDYRKFYGWSLKDVESAAHNILHVNAERVFKIKA